MGQYWAIVNLDTEAAYEMNKLGECIETLPLTKFFTRGYAIFSSDKLIERLHKDPPHYPFSAAELRKVEKPIPAAAQQRDSPFFTKLSTEPVDAIFAANADDFVTTVSLAVTCRQAWDIGAKRYFKLHLDAYYGSWNGNRMIILGDYACFDDLPEGIFTPKEQRFIDRRPRARCCAEEQGPGRRNDVGLQALRSGPLLHST
ncbi:hypothetical protein EXIGLDRAFT_754007 [Exidia glandulosa HHB12029]|uniref:Uncharacterized protein n=1 Tax=Exidia glandulosa HHB12029 TaxID=1314781 RepID=A0A165DBR2_EXIGL|nr:hypothetical protein EXIGLDRAFT_754007 [Exidia glandulosa HHB12029]